MILPCLELQLWNSIKKHWTGLNNALAYELDHHGKKDWFANTEQFGIYAWVAQAMTTR